MTDISLLKPTQDDLDKIETAILIYEVVSEDIRPERKGQIISYIARTLSVFESQGKISVLRELSKS